MKKSATKNYELQKQIGEGSYGKVYRALRKSDNKIMAIKIVNITRMDKIGIQSTLNEIRILHSVESDNIVGYSEAFLDSSETHLWIVMEFMGGGDLSSAIRLAKKENRRFPERVIWAYFIQILRGLSDLTRFKIMHRDIKPANIFISQDMKSVKIGDMNVSKVVKADLTRTQIGTPSYLAPEVWENRPYDSRCDVFSLGCCMYEMAALRLPFEARSMDELKAKIKNGAIQSMPSNYTEDLRSIIIKCLTKNPTARPSAEKLLNHPSIVLKIQELDLEAPYEIENAKLMDSILMPKNISMLNSKLPKKDMGARRSNSARVLRSFDKEPDKNASLNNKLDVNQILKEPDPKSLHKYQSEAQRPSSIQKSNSKQVIYPNNINDMFAKKNEHNVIKINSENSNRKIPTENKVNYESNNLAEKDGLSKNSVNANYQSNSRRPPPPPIKEQGSLPSQKAMVSRRSILNEGGILSAKESSNNKFLNVSDDHNYESNQKNPENNYQSNCQVGDNMYAGIKDSVDIKKNYISEQRSQEKQAPSRYNPSPRRLSSPALQKLAPVKNIPPAPVPKLGQIKNSAAKARPSNLLNFDLSRKSVEIPKNDMNSQNRQKSLSRGNSLKKIEPIVSQPQTPNLDANKNRRPPMKFNDSLVAQKIAKEAAKLAPPKKVDLVPKIDPKYRKSIERLPRNGSIGSNKSKRNESQEKVLKFDDFIKQFELSKEKNLRDKAISNLRESRNESLKAGGQQIRRVNSVNPRK